jgi:hypothetical protein
MSFWSDLKDATGASPAHLRQCARLSSNCSRRTAGRSPDHPTPDQLTAERLSILSHPTKLDCNPGHFGIVNNKCPSVSGTRLVHGLDP